MRCEACGGVGKKLVDRIVVEQRPWGELGTHVSQLEPCAACAGSGIAHCCEGEREQPEAQGGSDVV